MTYDPNGTSGAGTANTFASLQGNTKKQTPSQKRRMFAKIRKAIEGKR